MPPRLFSLFTETAVRCKTPCAIAKLEWWTRIPCIVENDRLNMFAMNDGSFFIIQIL